MRKLAQQLGVVPMAVYKHVADKDELLGGLVDVVVGEIDPPAAGTGWKSSVRQRILSARDVLLRHPWAAQVLHTMGSRILGFSQELFTAPAAAGPPPAGLADAFPHLAELAGAAAHRDDSIVGSGCDDQFEFEFALDLLLDGIEKLHRRGWTPAR